MDTLLKETVDATVNSRYPGMAPEGRKLIEDILIRKELEKGELLFKEGQVCHHMVFVGKGMMRQFYYKNGKDVTEHFSYEGCVIICIESTLKQEPTRLMAEALEPCTVLKLCTIKPIQTNFRAKPQETSTILNCTENSLLRKPILFVISLKIIVFGKKVSYYQREKN